MATLADWKIQAHSIVDRMSDMDDRETLKKVAKFLGDVESGCSFEAAVEFAQLQIAHPDLRADDWKEILPLLNENAWGWLSP